MSSHPVLQYEEPRPNSRKVATPQTLSPKLWCDVQWGTKLLLLVWSSKPTLLRHLFEFTKPGSTTFVPVPADVHKVVCRRRRKSYEWEG